ncbi:alpha/beta hydrolase [Nonomuraea deserti]|uniref:Alpha/beta hydrolase n=1 Tax=Nonomuraea deserti TaxID=1848322 RepID=A0A4R4VCR2_9ACTN|nr:alpha/beta hydrolase [Nonomuraea deserti]TDC97339.1 alpha/beta hydrolase [Nonomuraea deserti]
MITRETIEVDGLRASYLTAGERGPVVLLLHGTYWSRVWQPVLGDLAAAGLRPVAVDLPGLGRSEGELTTATAAVPVLAGWVRRFAAELGAREPLSVAGHDIGGAVAQHLLAAGPARVRRLALVNAVMYDSWPVPGVARYRDPAVVAATTAEELLAARRAAATVALGRPATEAELADYLDPWNDARVRRSWMALAGAADSRYTLGLVPALQADRTPKLLVWGEDDTFQELRHAERFAAEMPNTTLVRVPGAGHIPMENDPAVVARALADFFLE